MKKSSAIFLLSFVVVALLSTYSPCFSEIVEEPEAETKSSLKILKKNLKAGYLFKLGDTLHIEATGKYYEKIQEELEKDDTGSNFKLFLDDVKMEGLDSTLSKNIDEEKLTISFHIKRDSGNDVNRKAWDEFLMKQSSGYLMKPKVALAVGSEIAWNISTGKKFKFYIVTGKVVYISLAICLGLFVFAFNWLIKSPSALKDSANQCYSLGRSQMAFWGLLVFLTFSAIWVLNGTMEQIPDQALILLGISGATGLGSIVISQNKTRKREQAHQADKQDVKKELEALQEKQRVHPSTFTDQDDAHLAELVKKLKEINDKPSEVKTHIGFWRDISDDGSGVSVHRLQVILWTIILGAVFIRSVAQSMSIPEFPDTLLVLIGISNGIYLGFKFPEKS